MNPAELGGPDPSRIWYDLSMAECGIYSSFTEAWMYRSTKPSGEHYTYSNLLYCLSQGWFGTKEEAEMEVILYALGDMEFGPVRSSPTTY